MERKGRETFLTILLAVVLGGAFFFFLNLISFGIFYSVLAVVFGITAIGYFHYVLWGYSFSQDVAGEREEQELRERMEAERQDHGDEP
jgi:hypothetical protein